jgi:hypothetical protein
LNQRALELSGTTNLLSYILRICPSRIKNIFGSVELIDKIGMKSMLVETDMAGNLLVCPTMGNNA